MIITAHTYANVRVHGIEIADVPVEIGFTFRKGEKPILWALPEDCYPGSPDEFEIVSVKTDEPVEDAENGMDLLAEGVQILELIDDEELIRLTSLLEAPGNDD